MCSRCSSPWFDTNFSITVNPIQMAKKKAQKILKRIEDKSHPTRQRIAKKSIRKVNNSVVRIDHEFYRLFDKKPSSFQNVRCNVCRNENKIVVWKSVAETKNSQPTKTLQPLEEKPARPNRKKKRDKTAGLFISLVKEPVSTGPTEISAKKMPQKSAPLPKPMEKKKPTVKLIARPHSGPLPKKNNLLQLVNALKSKTNYKSNGENNKLQKLLR